MHEDLVGDVGAGGDVGADRQQPGMEIGTVAHVLEQVLARCEGRLPDPRGTLPAHVVQRQGVALGQPCREPVTADATHRQRPLGHTRRGVVRAARAEAGQAHQRALSAGESADCHRRLEGREPCSQRGIGLAAQQLGADQACEQQRIQLTARRHQRRAVRVALAGELRPPARGQVEQQARDLLLDDGALLLDHQQLLATRGEVRDARGLQRPHHRDLVDRDAEFGGTRLVDAELGQRVHHVEPGLAGAHDAEALARLGPDHAVEAVGTHEGLRRLESLQHLCLGHQRKHTQLQVEPARRQREILRLDDAHALRIHGHRGRAFDHIGHALEADPAARVARQRKAVEPEVEVFLDVAGNSMACRSGSARDRSGAPASRSARRGRRRRAPAPRRGASCPRSCRASADRRSGPPPAPCRTTSRRPRPRATRRFLHLLRTPHRGGREILVDAGLEMHVVRVRKRSACHSARS